MPFSTIEVDLEFQIELGSRQLPIHIFDVGPNFFPPFAPHENSVDQRDVVFKVNVFGRGDGKAELIRLSLFQPKPSVTDLTSIYDPPSYPGHGGNGDFLLSVVGNTTQPAKEDTPLFNDYIGPNWDPAPGQTFVMVWDQVAVLQDEHANTTWPGPRSEHRWDFTPVQNVPSPPGWTIPLRVASEGVSSSGEIFLLLLEIQRPHRLRMMARTVSVKPPDPIVIDLDPDDDGKICFVATAAYGVPHAPEIGILRNWRDETLSRHALGRAFVGTYYRLSPPVARVIARSSLLRRLARAVLDPVVRLISRLEGGGSG